ncbi:MAG: flavodoxin family protein [Deltaproteobacteria bacterium]|nr:flavodoxin family protein [Deltaproteobacteria bacterium]
MKVTTILGSPKEKGNTAKVLDLFEELITQDHEVVRINIATCHVNGCLGCYVCQKVTNEPGCIQNDDAAPIFERILSSDLIIYASPLYCWGFSSQMKALIDRHLCLVTGYGTPDHKSLLEGKLTALLVTCGGQIENNADLIQGIFDRVNNFSKCNVVGKYVVPSCTRDQIGTRGMEVAKKMAGDISQWEVSHPMRPISNSGGC